MGLRDCDVDDALTVYPAIRSARRANLDPKFSSGLYSVPSVFSVVHALVEKRFDGAGEGGGLVVVHHVARVGNRFFVQ
jgi:hypothetical protein